MIKNHSKMFKNEHLYNTLSPLRIHTKIVLKKPSINHSKMVKNHTKKVKNKHPWDPLTPLRIHSNFGSPELSQVLAGAPRGSAAYPEPSGNPSGAIRNELSQTPRSSQELPRSMRKLPEAVRSSYNKLKLSKSLQKLPLQELSPERIWELSGEVLHELFRISPELSEALTSHLITIGIPSKRCSKTSSKTSKNVQKWIPFQTP